MLVTDKKRINTFYQALLDKDPGYVGIFYAAVKTTSVFCIATCRAKKPKPENVEFYTVYKDALDFGYRPCKVCKPTENASQAPPQVQAAIDLVRDNLKTKISDDELKKNNITPEQVRRWFNKHYGMTFQKFQRMYRINNAYQELKSGRKNVTDIAFDIGYESLSGFGYTYKKVIGKSPTDTLENTSILISRFTTPLGPMFVCATELGVCLLEFVDRRMLETEFKDLQRLLKAKIIAGENNHIKQTKKEIAEYFKGRRTTFSVRLDTPGSEFQNKVWRALEAIPYGCTITYQQQAESMNKPKAVRAVATANGCNRIAILVPCHRVVGKNGNLTGYGGGLERKRWLIAHEQSHSMQQIQLKA